MARLRVILKWALCGAGCEVPVSGNVVSLAVDMTPYVSAAVGAYGGAVLARVRDEAADATVGLGRRLLQRIFGSREAGEPLPQPLADLAADPGDADALAAVRLAVRQVLAGDPVLAAEVQLMLAGAPGMSQRVQAGRDAYTSAGSLTVVNQYGSATGQRQVPGAARRVWGDIPPRNPGFTGRDGLLAAVRSGLLDGNGTAVQALQGIGGAGKTQLAVEYAYRFADFYDVVWWIAAEQTDLTGTQFAALADALGCSQPGGGTAELRRIVSAELEARGRWLVIFDNAEDPEYVAAWLPAGGGHVLITSRTRRWAEIAVPVDVDVLSRPESVGLLVKRIPGLSAQDADRMAAATGDLPLALAQAAGYLAETGISVADYTGLLGTHAAEALDRGRPVSYPRSLAAVTLLAFGQLHAEDPVAADLAMLCAFLAPEPVPVEWLSRAVVGPPSPPGEEAGDPYRWQLALARIGQHALARIGNGTVQMHRLTQAVLRAQQPPRQAAAARGRAEAIVALSYPGTSQDPSNWPGWARLLPHLLTFNPAASTNADLRNLACGAAWYLSKRGDAHASHELAEHLYQSWRDRLGPDHPDTLHAAYSLASALGRLGRYQEAKNLDEDTLARRRRTLGEDHLDTMRSANALALRTRVLGDIQAARTLDQDTLSRSRQVLGNDHPMTLGSANNLAVELRLLGDPQAARELEEDTLRRRRRVLGDDHPDTLMSATCLADDLRALDDYQAARDLDEDTLARYRRVLGEDHPDTLMSATRLADDLRALDDYQAARDLDEDTLARYRRVLGDDHPDTQELSRNLATDQRALD
jgi:Tetratricopeptide repeat